MKKRIGMTFIVLFLFTLMCGVTSSSAVTGKYYAANRKRIAVSGMQYNSNNQLTFNSKSYYKNANGRKVYVGGKGVYRYSANGKFARTNSYYNNNGRRINPPKIRSYYTGNRKRVHVTSMQYNSRNQLTYNSGCYYMNANGRRVSVAGQRVYCYNTSGRFICTNSYYRTDGVLVNPPCGRGNQMNNQGGCGGRR